MRAPYLPFKRLKNDSLQLGKTILSDIWTYGPEATLALLGTGTFLLTLNAYLGAPL